VSLGLGFHVGNQIASKSRLAEVNSVSLKISFPLCCFTFVTIFLLNVLLVLAISNVAVYSLLRPRIIFHTVVSFLSLPRLPDQSRSAPPSIMVKSNAPLQIRLTEPVIFLRGPSTGLDFRGRPQVVRDDGQPAMLRGLLTVRLAKPTRIRTISIQLAGKARTEWPEGKPV